MEFLSKLNCEINTDPNYTVASALIAGFLFAAISWGIVYVIIFLIFWEILYFGYLNVYEEKWNFNLRATVILAAILGYLLGREFDDNNDHIEDCNKFKDDVDYYGKEFGWFN